MDAASLNDLEIIDALAEACATYTKFVHRPRTHKELEESIQDLDSLIDEICKRKAVHNFYHIPFTPRKQNR